LLPRRSATIPKRQAREFWSWEWENRTPEIMALPTRFLGILAGIRFIIVKGVDSQLGKRSVQNLPWTGAFY
jgi:hypothetical protein